MLERLRGGDELAVGVLAAPFDLSPPAISKHLRVLEGAGLLVQEKEGRYRRCRFRPDGLAPARAWIETQRALWEGRLDDLAAYLEKGGGNDREGGA